mmetsp:Transcript_15292/g.14868  ORF Transcript_15292/g.14868 Transcript_15292/m.14868 type:complete len:147 (-) Transcript_15292:762-1202(-)
MLTRHFFEKETELFLTLNFYALLQYPSITLTVSTLFNQFLTVMKNNEKDQSSFSRMQMYVLENSIEYLIHVYFCINLEGYWIMRQVDISTSILHLLLHENYEGVMLMSRIFPKCLFKRFNNQGKLFKTFKWEKDQWSEFFKSLRTN